VPTAASSSTANAANSSGSLANTGLPDQLPWTLAIGTVLLIIGSVGRRLSLRASK
jgi:LPXTG-motif cell wall-anchored protein